MKKRLSTTRNAVNLCIIIVHIFSALSLAVTLALEPAAPALAAPVERPVPRALLDPAPGANPGQIRGTVFQDYNSNGVMNTSGVAPNLAIDRGVSGVTVTAYNAAGAVAGSAVSDANGAYTIIGVSDGTTYRVEFTNLPAGYQSSFRGTGSGTTSGTSVQFVTGGTGNVSYGIHKPANYCQADPRLVTVRQEAGASTTNGNAGVLSLPYTASGTTTQHTNDATVASVGSVWGVAYQRTTQRAFVSAFLKRQSGLGPRGADGVYVLDYAGATPSLMGGFDLQGVVPANGGAAIDVGTVTRTIVASAGTGNNELSSDPTQASKDMDAFAKVGKVGFGDIEMAEDNRTLWLVNLNQRTLIAVDTALVTPAATNPNPAPAAAVRQYNILPGGPAGATISGAPVCTNGQLRPWALAFHEGRGYLGVVCDASSASTYQGPADLKAYVLSFDPNNPTSFTTELTVDLDYPREYAYTPLTSTGNPPLPTPRWQRWLDSWNTTEIQTGPFSFLAAPQPILSDITFTDDGSMVLGFMDRFAHQQGWRNYNAVAGSTTLHDGVTSGDLLRAQRSGATYTLEGGSSEPATITNSTGTATSTGLPAGGYRTDDGPSGTGEFFWGDYFFGSDAIHGETLLGGIALLPGSNEVVSGAMDPLAFNSQGLRWLSPATGAQTRAYQVVGNTANVRHFGKGAAMGDIELLCDAAPIEIGNRVWNDANSNGIQDPGEAGLDGVTVELYRNGVLVGTTTTANGGQYYFNNSNVTLNGASGIVPGTGVVNGNSEYQIRIPNATGGSQQASLAGLTLTEANDAIPSPSGSDLNDSDGTLSGTNAIYTIPYSALAGPGYNNHTFDFGFAPTQIYSLGNRVWYDTNNDGIDNDGAGGGLGTGVGGVTVQLLDSSGNLLATTTTDGNGYYRFDNLVAGAYRVVLPASNFASGGVLANYQNSASTVNTNLDARDHGTVNGTLGAGGDVRSALVTLGPGLQPTGETGVGGGTNGPGGDINDNLTVDFGFYQLVLGNRVWYDDNRNGLDDFEPGVAGVTVTLLDGSGNPLATTTTDASGYYTFTNLAAGAYRVQIQAPANYVSTSPDDTTNNTDGNDNGQGTSGGTITSQTFTLVPGVVSGDITVNSATGRTRNLTIDFGLYQPSADLEVVKSVTPPTYTVGTATNIQYTFAITNHGPDPVVNAPVTDPQPANITFNSWTCAIQNAGSGSGANACGAASGSGNINTTISLRTGASAVWTVNATVSAAATGTIVNTASEALPAGMAQSSPNRPDSANAQIVPTQPFFSVGNRVWFDTNDDGATTGPGVAEPVPSVLMQLVDLSTGQVIQTTTTGPNGYYRFDYVPAGDYQVVVAASNFQPAGPLYGYRNSSFYTADTTLAGDNRDHAPNTSANPALDGVRSVAVTLGIGLQPVGETAVGGGDDGPHGDANSNLTIDFGFNKQHTGNQLWYDLNNNGIFDPGEPPVPAGVVVVMGVVVNGIDIGPVLTTTTDANGFYDFSAGNNIDLDPTGVFLYVAIPPGQPALNSYVPSTPRREGGGLDNFNTGALGATGIITSGLFYPLPGSTANGAIVNDDLGETYQPTIDFGFVLQTYSLGNRVWFDTDNNGVLDAGEQGASGVVVELRAANGDVVATTVTGPDGYYRFDNLLAGTYEVVVAASNFTAGGALYGYQNSTPTTAPSNSAADDSRDHGINSGTPGIEGVRSGPITLGPGLQPTGEPDVGGGNGPGGDATDNLTIDFGFYQLSLGDRVWNDANNDGIYDPASESGIDGVTVRLFAGDGVTEIPVGPDGVLGTADDGPGGVVTSDRGQYRFSGLTPGDYIVKITPPAGYTSSTGTNGSSSGPYEPAPDPDTNLDHDDNGSNGVGADAGLVVSQPVTLTPGNPGAANNNNVDTTTASTYDPTVDFGLFQPLSLGNLVWFDANNNGLLEAGEVGIDGVVVNLYYDANHDGDLDDPGERTPILTTVTAGGGLYLFTNLAAGNYVVELAASNFAAPAGGPPGVLVGYTSSTGASGVATGPYEPAPDPNTNGADNDDNGTVVGTLGSGGTIRSGIITLSAGNEPAGEDPNNDPATPDHNSNLTIDFGVFQAYSLGNRVWFDADNNGFINGGEVGIDGVIVRLYASDGTTLVAETTTANGGYYRFDNLLAGDYIVAVDISSPALAGYSSSTVKVSSPNLNPTDSDNNGVIEVGNEVRSDPITLGPGQPTGETDLFDGQGAPDDRANMTVDFGFYIAPTALGDDDEPAVPSHRLFLPVIAGG